jgi:hypothetical protein
MKYKLKLKPLDGGAFNCMPAREVEVDAEHIICNDVRFPWDFNPHNVRLWCIGNEFGVLGCVWASSEQDAFDELCDNNLSAGLMVDEPESFESDEEREEWEESICRLGNAGEPHDMDYASIQLVDIKACGIEFMCKLAEARGAGADNLYQV